MVYERIRVSGIVQGVGFRPTVWRLAQDYQLKGQVWNDAKGVLIDAWGNPDNLDQFVDALINSPPPLASIDQIDREVRSDQTIPDEFSIVESDQGVTQTGVAADAASCDACIAEIFDPENRRYRYPFTNCTHCGPRLSIIHAIPYDRANTAMSVFPQCPKCLSEYTDPSDRRFHAQPNACPECGPSVWLSSSKGELIDTEKVDPIEQAAELIRSGFIVAIKGIGGFHLACDARNEQVVRALRDRKKRYAKPFAMMARDRNVIQEYAVLRENESDLLSQAAAPIVLLETKASTALANSVAPEQDRLGFMLPYSPLHHLLFTDLGFPVVMTSANLSEEPQCISNEHALEKLAEIADYFLLNDRDIVNRLDDSVVLCDEKQTITFRRSRGYSPTRFLFPEGFDQLPAKRIMAMGGELKNTFTISNQQEVIVSQYIGDLENAETLADYQHNLDLYQRLYDHQADVIVIDQHADYFSSQLGESLANKNKLELIKVQHHHAHIAACMAEYELPLNTEKILGVAYDGLGMGDDNTLWGGEFLFTDYVNYQRVGAFSCHPLIGGGVAMLEPWRNTYAHLSGMFEWEALMKEFGAIPLIQKLHEKPRQILDRMIANGLNSPISSSCGRLFDAVAGLLGLHTERISYEGQAAMALERLAKRAFHSESEKAYSALINQEDGIYRIDWKPLWLAILRDLSAQIESEKIAARFHHGLIEATVKMVEKLQGEMHFQKVALSGGCFQNSLLRCGLQEKLQAGGYQVLIPQKLPMNDGGLSFGQLHIARAQLRR